MSKNKSYPYVIQKEMERQEQMRDEPSRCPRCGSMYLTANKKGFSATKGAIGAVTLGIIPGAIFGSHGSNKVIVTCMKCGHQWKL